MITGGDSLLYGPGGNGGIINIITKQGQKGVHGSVSVETGSESERIGRFTLSGWSGRFVEFGRLRDYDDVVRVDQFEENGIKVLSVDRNALVPWHDHKIETRGWVRPRLWGFGPVLPVVNINADTWRVVGIKKDEPVA